MTNEEAWEAIGSQKRLWFPIPVAWRSLPELQGTAIFFNKYPSVYDEVEKPDMDKIYALEPSISNQDLNTCRANIRKIGPKYVAAYNEMIHSQAISQASRNCATHHRSLRCTSNS